MVVPLTADSSPKSRGGRARGIESANLPNGVNAQGEPPISLPNTPETRLRNGHQAPNKDRPSRPASRGTISKLLYAKGQFLFNHFAAPRGREAREQPERRPRSGSEVRDGQPAAPLPSANPAFGPMR